MNSPESPDSPPSRSELLSVLERALERRADLAADPDTTTYRLIHGWSEGCPRIEVDRWDSVLTIEARESSQQTADRLAEVLDAELSPEAVIVKVRGRDPYVAAGRSPGQIVATEAGLRFAIEPMRPRNPGLHLDARPARAWLRGASSGRRVLNLFCFTGSLGLAASVGGARSVSHVDMQKTSLSRTRANYRLNNLRIDDRDLLRLNIYQHLRRASAKRQRYGGIIVDAPPYAPHKDRTPGGRGVVEVAHQASAMLEAGAWLLCFFHHDLRAREELEREILDAVAQPLEVIWRGESGSDFPEEDPNRKSRMTAFQVVA